MFQTVLQCTPRSRCTIAQLQAICSGSKPRLNLLALLAMFREPGLNHSKAETFANLALPTSFLASDRQKSRGSNLSPTYAPLPRQRRGGRRCGQEEITFGSVIIGHLQEALRGFRSSDQQLVRQPKPTAFSQEPGTAECS